MSERRKILDMLAAGQVSAEEADDLLNALGSNDAARPNPPQKVAKILRINISTDDGTNVHVNIPLALAKFATQFLHKDARKELEVQGIDLAALVDALGSDMPDGELINIDAFDEDEGRRSKIIIEVV